MSLNNEKASQLSRSLFSFFDFLNHQSTTLGLAITLLAIRQFGDSSRFIIATDILGTLLGLYSLYVSVKATQDFRSFMSTVQPEEGTPLHSMKSDIFNWIVVGYANIAIVVLCVGLFMAFNIYEYMIRK